MLKFIILLLINITLASKTFILSVDLPSNCNYTTINSIPEFCTYNYNIIKNYNTICNKKVIIPNIGCSIDNKNRYVIYNLYIVKNNITILSDTYNTIYTNMNQNRFSVHIIILYDNSIKLQLWKDKDIVAILKEINIDKYKEWFEH